MTRKNRDGLRRFHEFCGGCAIISRNFCEMCDCPLSRAAGNLPLKNRRGMASCPQLLVARDGKGGCMAERRLRNSVADHRKKSAIRAGVAVITLSTSRSLDTDKSGDVIQELLEEKGHKVEIRKLLPDKRSVLRAALRNLVRDKKVHAIITTGGTGLAPMDVTIEAVRDMLDKELPGFNSLFMLLSYPKVKSACMLSRALAGTMGGKAIFCLPGSPRACKLAVESLILPELGHILMLLGG
jgi:molybdenum cofactor biosynthesis protein B